MPAWDGAKVYQILREGPVKNGGKGGSPEVVASAMSVTKEVYGKGPEAGISSALKHWSFGGGADWADCSKGPRSKPNREKISTRGITADKSVRYEAKDRQRLE